MLGSDRIIALDIGASTVKIGEFQAGKGHGLRLTNFNYADLGIDPEHEENRKELVVSTIRNALREKNIKSRPVIFSVSGQSVFTRFVKLPPSASEQRENLEQLRALDAGMRIDAMVVNSVPLGVDTPEDLDRARAMLGG